MLRTALALLILVVVFAAGYVIYQHSEKSPVPTGNTGAPPMEVKRKVGKPHVANKNKAEAALATAIDVRMVVIGPGMIFVMIPYGPCATLSQIGQEYVFDGDRVGRNIFDTKDEAVTAAANDCELVYLTMKKEREQAQRMITKPQ